MGQINEILNESLASLRKMMEANNVIGEALTYNDTTIVPVTNIHIGFLSGGSDIKPNSSKDDPLFGGATSGGVIINPCGFLVIKKDEVSFVSVDNKTHIYERILEYFSNINNKEDDLKV